MKERQSQDKVNNNQDNLFLIIIDKLKNWIVRFEILIIN